MFHRLTSKLDAAGGEDVFSSSVPRDVGFLRKKGALLQPAGHTRGCLCVCGLFHIKSQPLINRNLKRHLIRLFL